MRLIPLNLSATHDGSSSRQRVTCRYRCGDACAHPEPNTSDNEYFGDLSNWPAGGNGAARPAVVAVWKDGGQIGL